MKSYLHLYAEKSAFHLGENRSAQRCGWIWYSIAHAEFSAFACRVILKRAAELKFFTT
jgi:hypothetical protein